MSISATSERLRELARVLANELITGGAAGVAVTGSVARGDADEGSDLELWALSNGALRVDRFSRNGLPITVFHEPSEAFSDVAHLANVDVRESVIVLDPRGELERLLTQAKALDSQIIDYAVPLLEESVDALRRASAAGGVQGRLLTLRELADRWVTLELMRLHGMRSWKLRHVSQRFGDDAVRLLRAVHGLPVTEQWLRGLVESVPAVSRAIVEHLRVVGSDHVPSGPPGSGMRQLSVANRDEAVRQFRKWMTTEFLRPLQRAAGPIHVQRYIASAVPPPLAMFWSAVHGLDTDEETLDAKECEARAAVEGLMLLTRR